MKIISVDNPDRKIVRCTNDELVADHVDAYYVDTLVAVLNATYGANEPHDRFFKAVPNDYVLKTYES
jgi:hypothetical protein